MKAAMQDIQERYYNPDPLLRLIDESNETDIQIDGNRMTTLIDSGAQISAITKGMAKKMKLKVQKLQKLLRIEGTRGGKVPYKGYVEVLLEVPGVKNLSEYILMLVIEDSEYGERVPIQIGTLHIDMILEKATADELNKLGKAFNRSRVTSPTVNQKGCFNLYQVKGPIKVTKEVIIEPGETIKVNGLTGLKGNTKRLHIVAEPMEQGGSTDLLKIITVPTYSQCMPGSQKVPVMVRNVTNEVVKLRKGMVIAKLSAANLIPNKVAPRYIEERNSKVLEISERNSNTMVRSKSLIMNPEQRQEKLIEKLSLEGMNNWGIENQERAKFIMKKYHDIFTLEPLELGRTNIVKHVIKVNNPVPFKERYRRIPPHQYKEVCKHLKEMEEIGSIRRSNSPWASPVVLVCKKDGSLHFCIDLRKLNAQTIKDTYSLPQIEESLDCLNGVCIFSSLDLKSGYWQVELDDDSIPLTAFMVGPLGFYECV